MSKTTVDLSEKAELVKKELMPIFGLKNILSSGLLLFDRLSSDDQKRLIAEANGIETEDIAERAASAARFCIKIYQALNTKNLAASLKFLSAEENYAIREMLNALNPELLYKKRKRKKSS